ncbi:hypothetical protein BOTBODRAFT_218127 [Botryobasidium botryosum FD-172 SS1]|uniref:Uncharacterized protein n=1 Tax=Botryobasidium botryosum (strain FD-172 SS1) TaxID=930990 RepID=A0A067MM96_BOTB1|nr:hypothetical protein BOTBODRAFT_218127 [Botryobasidium botryosum FD-172 SS1]
MPQIQTMSATSEYLRSLLSSLNVVVFAAHSEAPSELNGESGVRRGVYAETIRGGIDVEIGLLLESAAYLRRARSLLSLIHHLPDEIVAQIFRYTAEAVYSHRVLLCIAGAA